MHRSAILNGAAVMGLMCWLLSPAAATKLVTTPEEAVEVLKNKTPATISPCLITSSGAGADFIGGYVEVKESTHARTHARLPSPLPSLSFRLLTRITARHSSSQVPSGLQLDLAQ